MTTTNPNNYPQLFVAREIAAEEFRRDTTGAMASIQMNVWNEMRQTVGRVTFTRKDVLGEDA